MVYQVGQQHGVETELEAIATRITQQVKPFWLDMEGTGEEMASWLGVNFPFHPLALDDLSQPSYRPRLVEYEGHLFLVAHAVAYVEGEVEAQEIHCFLTHDGLVTAHEAPSAAIDLAERTLGGNGGIRRGPDYILYLILNQIAETYFTLVDSFDDTIDVLEVDVLDRGDREVRDRVFAIRQGLATLRRLGSSLRDAMGALLAHENGYIRRPNTIFIRDVHNTMVTVHEIVDSQRDLTSGVLEVYLSSVSNRLNDVMKRLTIVATIFLPISFIASVFGTNFASMPFDDSAWYGLFIMSLILTPLAMLVWFRHSGWF
jgi:magnesium transporter